MSEIKGRVAGTRSGLRPESLAALLVEPSWADLDPADRRCLILDLREEYPLTEDDVLRTRRWLERQYVPIIGFGPARMMPLVPAVDLVVSTAAELERVVENVDRNPRAAAVLVQVLRTTEALGVADALTVESLAYATLQSGAEFAAWLEAQREDEGSAATRQVDDIVLLDRVGGRLSVVLNSPDTRNALSVAMRDALAEAFKLVVADDTIDTVGVSGKGPCFSAGGDLTEFGTAPDPSEAHAIRMLRMPARYLAQRADRYAFHVHRACIGAGIELPAFAGRLTATANTFFQLPELSMGLIPGAGGCVSIPRRIGRQRTAYMALLGKKIPAQRALEWGLIDAIVDQDAAP